MNKKKIYLLFYDQCIVNGGFFDNFEYYYIIKKAFKNCDVKYRVITDHPRSEVLSMLDDKYDGIEWCFTGNVISSITVDINCIRC